MKLDFRLQVIVLWYFSILLRPSTSLRRAWDEASGTLEPEVHALHVQTFPTATYCTCRSHTGIL